MHPQYLWLVVGEGEHAGAHRGQDIVGFKEAEEVAVDLIAMASGASGVMVGRDVLSPGPGVSATGEWAGAARSQRTLA